MPKQKSARLTGKEVSEYFEFLKSGRSYKPPVRSPELDKIMEEHDDTKAKTKKVLELCDLSDELL